MVSAEKSTALVVADDVHVHFPVAGRSLFGRDVLRAVDGVSLSIQREETIGLVGESGCGKSTLGRALIGLRPTTSGSVSFDGHTLAKLREGELRRLRKRMQIVFQDPYGSMDPRMKVEAIIAEPIRTHRLREGKAVRERVVELLGLVGLQPDMKDRSPHEFSGGQRQRIAIARALAAEPDFIVCDEPISALDVSIQAQILNLLMELRQRLSLTYLFVAHDVAVVRRVSSRIVVMYLGRVVESGSRDAIFDRPSHPYTVALLSAVPTANPAAERNRRRIVLSGEIPSPVSPPPGCTFHTRCWLYQQRGKPEICRTTPPPLDALEEGHHAACHFPIDDVSQRTPALHGRA